MTLLETTIIEQALHELQNLRQALLMAEGDDRATALSASFWMLTGLTMLASLKDSGLSDIAVAKLNAIECESGQAISAAGLVGVFKDIGD